MPLIAAEGWFARYTEETFERRETRVKFDPSDEPRDRGSRWDFDDAALKASVAAEPRLTVGGIVERLASPICARFIVA